jgi:ATP-dependent exoDNAse (exonuclease V) alpha subunit
MNNPLPRTSGLLSTALANKANRALAESVKVPGVTPREEQMADRLVAQILDQAQVVIEEQTQASESYAEQAEYEAEHAIEYRESERHTGFVLPRRHESGLYNPEITLDESQLAAVESLADKQYGALIGAAGTGKTTVQKYLIQRLVYGSEDGESEPELELRMLGDGQGLNVAIIAFTGMAVQVIRRNLPSWMHSCAKTIHGLLEFAPEESIGRDGKPTRIFLPQRHNLRKLDHDLVIIDEASMVGLDLWKQLLAALKPGTRIIMTGDLNQLPPIIGQPVFAFALSQWHVSELTKVHRQKEAGANRIVEVAHDILNGRMPKFDDTKGNPHWRVAQFTLKDKAKDAYLQILSILNQVRNVRLDPSVDPEESLIYDPYRDRVMTAGNGYDENVESSLVQQAPLNEALSTLIQPPDEDHPRFVIDAGRIHKKFAVGLRVMATKNEGAATVDRVTNGQTGVITEIVENGNYVGDRKLFGKESDVQAELKHRVNAAVLGRASSLGSLAESNTDGISDGFDNAEGELADFGLQQELDSDAAATSGGFSSHTVVVRFDNGAVRRFASKAGVESLYLAYASTVAKCQGSQFPTAIIIVHPAQKGQLSREWLYTAVTRAEKRVIILKTEYGLRYALSRQRIHGKTIQEKIQRYQQMLSEEGVATAYGARYRVNVPLTIESFDGAQPGVEWM